jgi:hypothetical protein
MVGVAADREGEDHDAGPEIADLLDHDAPAGLVIGEVGIGKPGIPALGKAEHPGRGLGLAGAHLSTPQRPTLASREIEHAGTVPRIDDAEQGAGAGELHVVAVRGDGEDVNGHKVGGERLAVSGKMHRLTPPGKEIQARAPSPLTAY